MTHSQGNPDSNRRPPLLAFAALALLWAAVPGCGSKHVEVRPIYDEGLQRPIEQGRAAFIEYGGIRLTLRDAGFDLHDEGLTAVEIELYNDTNMPVTLRLDDVSLIPDRGRPCPAVSPGFDGQSRPIPPPDAESDDEPELLYRLWRESDVAPGQQRRGVILFRYPPEKRQVIRFEFFVSSLSSAAGDTDPASGPAGKVRFAFLFYTT
jgi:hypothetical protein